MNDRRVLLSLVCFVLLVFFSCKKENTSDNTVPTNNSTGNISGNVNKAVLLQLVNDVRQTGCNCGSTAMPPVVQVMWNDQLTTAAFNHSNEMNSNNYFNHTGLNGSTAGDRISAAGYAWKAYGENIAKGYSSEQSVMADWLKSEGHCKNIMGALFREMGVARVGGYWTQEFASK